jgi:resuscitation-promoting factor RpfB
MPALPRAALVLVLAASCAPHHHHPYRGPAVLIPPLEVSAAEVVRPLPLPPAPPSTTTTRPPGLVATTTTTAVRAAGMPAASRGGARSTSALNWEALRWCENRKQCQLGDCYRSAPGDRYRGAYQFSFATWSTVGGSGDPAAAPAAEQDLRARLLYERDGRGQWPVCGSRL